MSAEVQLKCSQYPTDCKAANLVPSMLMQYFPAGKAITLLKVCVTETHG